MWTLRAASVPFRAHIIRAINRLAEIVVQGAIEWIGLDEEDGCQVVGAVYPEQGRIRSVPEEFTERTAILLRILRLGGANEEVEAETAVDDLAVGFNVGYLLDALSALRGDKVRINLRDAQSSCLLQEEGNDEARHVVMPLRL